jgi:hypothetical protein
MIMMPCGSFRYMGWRLVHRSDWKGCSPKFACFWFSEVRICNVGLASYDSSGVGKRPSCCSRPRVISPSCLGSGSAATKTSTTAPALRP